MSATSNPASVSLSSDREILIERDLRAPKALVFDAWTKPEHIRHWYPCSTLTLSVCEVDLQIGGKWRYVLVDASGAEHALSGEFVEIDVPDRLVHTSRYEPVLGSDHVVTVTFVEREGVTKVAQRFLHASKEARDGHLQSGITSGIDDMFDRIERVIAATAS